MFKRVIVVVLNSVRIGVLFEAVYYGVYGVNTIANIVRQQGGFFLNPLENGIRVH